MWKHRPAVLVIDDPSRIAVPYEVPVCRLCEAQSHPRPKTELDSNLVGRRVLEDLPRAFCDSADEKTGIAGSVWLTGGGGGGVWLMGPYKLFETRKNYPPPPSGIEHLRLGKAYLDHVTR